MPKKKVDFPEEVKSKKEGDGGCGGWWFKQKPSRARTRTTGPQHTLANNVYKNNRVLFSCTGEDKPGRGGGLFTFF